MDETKGAFLERMVGVLLPAGPRSITLDEIGDAIGTEAVGADLVEALIDRLQALGAEIAGEEGGDLTGLLREVLGCARLLRNEGLPPSPQNISERRVFSVR